MSCERVMLLRGLSEEGNFGIITWLHELSTNLCAGMPASLSAWLENRMTSANFSLLFGKHFGFGISRVCFRLTAHNVETHRNNVLTDVFRLLRCECQRN